MSWIKKKIVHIFCDGSLNFDKTLLKKLKRVQISDKDHTTFTFNKKNSNLVLNSKSFENFKTNYLKF